MKILLANVIAMLAIGGAYASVPAGYYDSLEGKSGLALRNAAATIGKNHKRITYSSGTWDAFAKTDVRIVNGREAWWDMYCNNIVYLPGHSGLNIEHSVAQSWWGGGHNNDQGCDLFHLNPSDSDANNRKANYPLGEIEGNPTWTNGVTNVGYAVSGQGGGAPRVYEPADEYKGDFARAFMYVFTTYYDISWSSTTAWMYDTSNMLLFRPWAVELLLRWSAEDPVDEKESARNEAVYKIQGNRNPFIDMPHLADHIWGSKSSEGFHADGSVTDPNPNPNPNPDPEPGDELLDCNFENGGFPPTGWKSEVVSGSLTGWYSKSYQGNTYATASAYKGSENGGPYEFWLITPQVDVPAGKEGLLTFRTQGAYGVDDCNMEVYLLSSPADAGEGTGTKLDAKICTPNPTGSSVVYCDWVSSGDVAVASGKHYIGFRYYSARGGNNNSATYCLDDVKLITKATSGINITEQEIEQVYTEDGRIIAPEGSRVFNLSGVEVGSAPGAGLYVVVTPRGKSVKVVCR